jgi:murein L,D-transpeptidase YafK
MILLLLIGMLAAEDSVTKADQVLVVKSQRTLTLLSHGKVLHTYKVALGGSPVGAKEQQGDHKTPEGHYISTGETRRAASTSRFTFPIRVIRTNRKRPNAESLPVATSWIHGLPNGFGWLGATHRARDWTDGCIAVTDTEMDEIWELVPDGTLIEIRP